MAELQFVGDIKAYRAGDKIKAFATVQSRRTGNYLKVETEIDIPTMKREASQVFQAAKSYLERQGVTLPALEQFAAKANGVLDDGSLSGFGAISPYGRQMSMKARAAEAKAKAAQMALDMQKRGFEKQQIASAVNRMKEQFKSQMAQQMASASRDRTAANQRANLQIERQQTKDSYEDKLRNLQGQLHDRDLGDDTRAQLEVQASQYEDLIAKMDVQDASAGAVSAAEFDASGGMSRADVERKFASPSPTDAPQDVAPFEGEVIEAGYESITGMGWAFTDLFAKFSKVVAVVARNKIVGGLVKAATVYAAKSGWKIPGLNLTVENARVWWNLLQSAKTGHHRAVAIVNRVKLMARLGQPAAIKTYWLLRDLERLAPEVKAQIAGGPQAQLTGMGYDGDGKEPGSVLWEALESGEIGPESETPAHVRFQLYDPESGAFEQVPYRIAMGAKRPVKKGLTAQKKRAAQQRAARQRAAQARSQSGTAQTVRPGMMPAQMPPPNQMPYPSANQTPYPSANQTPYPSANQSGSQAGYPPGYSPYDQGGGGGGYPSSDYSQAEQQPGFDPYSAASYGYDPNQFSSDPLPQDGGAPGSEG